MDTPISGTDLRTTFPPVPPGPIQYELRIGVSGHRELTDPEAVERAVQAVVRHLVNVLESASAEPLGPHGTPQSTSDRVDRALTQGLAFGTRVVCPLLDALTGAAATLVRRETVHATAVRWPRVPRILDAPEPPRRTPLKLTVVSALAAGADQIVARAVCSVIDHPEHRNRYLEAVLPVPQRLYEEDFADARDLQAFRALLALDRGRWNTHPQPTVLCPDFPACLDPIEPAIPLSREKAYAAAGRYVVESSEILIAIWDPDREEKTGGTGETVRYAIDRGRVVLWLNPADLQSGAFLLGRAEDAAIGGLQAQRPRRAPRGLRAEPVPTRAKRLSRNFHRLAAYNRDPATDDGRLAREVEDSTTRFYALARGAGLPEPAADTLAGALVPHAVRADHLSARYRELRDLASRLWPTAAAVVVTLMAFQIVFLPDHYWLAALELAVLLLGYVSYRVSLYGGWHEKWLNDKRLADGLRAALYTAVVLSDEDLPADRGLGFASAGVSRHLQDPLPFFDPANTWFVATVKRVLRKERRTFAGTVDFDRPDHRSAVRGLLRDGWIRPEIESHARGARRRAITMRRAGRIRLGLVLALMVVALLHAFGVGHGGDHEGTPPLARLDLWIAFATVALPAWAAAFHAMLSLDDGERRAERSALMASLLRGLADRLESADTLGELRECVADAERIMDLESREWAESLVERRPEFTG